MDTSKERVLQLRAEAAAARELAVAKDAEAERAILELNAAEHKEVLQLIVSSKCELVCPFCGTALRHTNYEMEINHIGCYNTGVWTKGYTKHNDWLIDSLENGKKIAKFHEDAKKESNSFTG